MNTNIRTMKAKKGISLMVLGGVALLTAAFALPMQQAFAACSKSSGGTTATNSTSSSVSGNTGSSTLICVSRTSALTTLGLGSSSANGNSSSKATICHIPPGNPDQKMTLSVGQSSVPAHLDHGDSLGSCDDLQTQAYVESLPSCTAMGSGSTEPGVWLPENTVADDTSLNAYLAQVQGGSVSGQPDSLASSYREISGQ